MLSLPKFFWCIKISHQKRTKRTFDEFKHSKVTTNFVGQITSRFSQKYFFFAMEAPNEFFQN